MKNNNEIFSYEKLKQIYNKVFDLELQSYILGMEELRSEFQYALNYLEIPDNILVMSVKEEIGTTKTKGKKFSDMRILGKAKNEKGEFFTREFKPPFINLDNKPYGFNTFNVQDEIKPFLFMFNEEREDNHEHYKKMYNKYQKSGDLTFLDVIESLKNQESYGSYRENVETGELFSEYNIPDKFISFDSLCKFPKYGGIDGKLYNYLADFQYQSLSEVILIAEKISANLKHFLHEDKSFDEIKNLNINDIPDTYKNLFSGLLTQLNEFVNKVEISYKILDLGKSAINTKENLFNIIINDETSYKKLLPQNLLSTKIGMEDFFTKKLPASRADIEKNILSLSIDNTSTSFSNKKRI